MHIHYNCTCLTSYMYIIRDKCLDVDIFKIFVHNIRMNVLKTDAKIITLVQYVK